MRLQIESQAIEEQKTNCHGNQFGTFMNSAQNIYANTNKARSGGNFAKEERHPNRHENKRKQKQQLPQEQFQAFCNPDVNKTHDSTSEPSNPPALFHGITTRTMKRGKKHNCYSPQFGTLKRKTGQKTPTAMAKQRKTPQLQQPAPRSLSTEPDHHHDGVPLAGSFPHAHFDQYLSIQSTTWVQAGST